MPGGRIKYRVTEENSQVFNILTGILLLLTLGGAWAAWVMYHDGHHLTGMSNRVPWGLPIVMAIYLIGLSAGSLVLSALGSVFGKDDFKPFSRIAAIMATLLLIGALISIILDWGRPDRLLVPFFHMNLRSMFSLNGILYSTYIAICIIYLVAMFSGWERAVKIIGIIAVFWAILVHSGTGAIFGFVGARELYHSPLLPPSFIAAALSSGTALMIIILLTSFSLTGRYIDKKLVYDLGYYLAVFIAIVTYFIFVENITRSYFPSTYHTQSFLLLDGNKYTWYFWIGMVGCGNIFPLLILLNKTMRSSVTCILVASILVVGGVLAERYIIVLPAQVLPLDIFPDWTMSSQFNDGTIATYSATSIEIIYSIGIMAFVFLLYLLSIRLLAILPDSTVMPEYVSAETAQEPEALPGE